MAPYLKSSAGRLLTLLLGLQVAANPVQYEKRKSVYLKQGKAFYSHGTSSGDASSVNSHCSTDSCSSASEVAASSGAADLVLTRLIPYNDNETLWTNCRKSLASPMQQWVLLPENWDFFWSTDTVWATNYTFAYQSNHKDGIQRLSYFGRVTGINSDHEISILGHEGVYKPSTDRGIPDISIAFVYPEDRRSELDEEKPKLMRNYFHNKLGLILDEAAVHAAPVESAQAPEVSLIPAMQHEMHHTQGEDDDHRKPVVLPIPIVMTDSKTNGNPPTEVFDTGAGPEPPFVRPQPHPPPPAPIPPPTEPHVVPVPISQDPHTPVVTKPAAQPETPPTGPKPEPQPVPSPDTPGEPAHEHPIDHETPPTPVADSFHPIDQGTPPTPVAADPVHPIQENTPPSPVASPEYPVDQGIPPTPVAEHDNSEKPPSNPLLDAENAPGPKPQPGPDPIPVPRKDPGHGVQGQQVPQHEYPADHQGTHSDQNVEPQHAPQENRFGADETLPPPPNQKPDPNYEMNELERKLDRVLEEVKRRQNGGVSPGDPQFAADTLKFEEEVRAKTEAIKTKTEASLEKWKQDGKHPEVQKQHGEALDIMERNRLKLDELKGHLEDIDRHAKEVLAKHPEGKRMPQVKPTDGRGPNDVYVPEEKAFYDEADTVMHKGKPSVKTYQGHRWASPDTSHRLAGQIEHSHVGLDVGSADIRGGSGRLMGEIPPEVALDPIYNAQHQPFTNPGQFVDAPSSLEFTGGLQHNWFRPGQDQGPKPPPGASRSAGPSAFDGAADTFTQADYDAAAMGYKAVEGNEAATALRNALLAGNVERESAEVATLVAEVAITEGVTASMSSGLRIVSGFLCKEVAANVITMAALMAPGAIALAAGAPGLAAVLNKVAEVISYIWMGNMILQALSDLFEWIEKTLESAAKAAEAAVEAAGEAVSALAEGSIGEAVAAVGEGALDVIVAEGSLAAAEVGVGAVVAEGAAA